MKLLTINQMSNIAEERNGECLSKFYKNSRSNLLWKCANGHKWEATPDNVKRGTWCPYCRKTDNIGEEKCRYIFEWLTGYKFPKNRLVLNNRQELSRDGLCLSMAYANCKTHLIWKCSNSHTWNATPEKIMNGQWCRNCYDERRRRTTV